MWLNSFVFSNIYRGGLLSVINRSWFRWSSDFMAWVGVGSLSSERIQALESFSYVTLVLSRLSRCSPSKILGDPIPLVRGFQCLPASDGGAFQRFSIFHSYFFSYPNHFLYTLLSFFTISQVAKCFKKQLLTIFFILGMAYAYIMIIKSKKGG